MTMTMMVRNEEQMTATIDGSQLPACHYTAGCHSITTTGYDKHCVVCRRIAAWLAGIDMNPR